MKRALVLLATAALGVLGAAAPAAADKPERAPVLIDDFVLPDSCAFPVLVEVIANNEHVTFFPNGRLHVNGKLFVRLTNLDDPANVVTVNASGPGFITPTSERGAGRGVVFLRPGEFGGPGLILTNGRVDFVRAENGFISDMTVRGRTVDICAVLAA